MLLYLLHHVSLWEQRILCQVDETQPPFPRHIGPSGGVISFAEDGGQEHHFRPRGVGTAGFLCVLLCQNQLMAVVASSPPHGSQSNPHVGFDPFYIQVAAC